jgi:hypothetical protein
MNRGAAAGAGTTGGEHRWVSATAAPAPFEPRWPEAVAVLVAMALYATLPDQVLAASHATTVVRVVLPALELVLLIPLVVTAPHRHVYESGRRRMVAITLIAIVSVANVLALGLLIHALINSDPHVQGRQLLVGGFQVWWTNVIAFALWFWELDGGGPPARLRNPSAPRDFAFVQMTDPEVAAPGWRPRFADYFYVSFTNASAFSPTDTLPLSRTAKWLMLGESTVSLVTLLLVAARAVNILA